MANKMLIDATHSEETRVVVVRGNRVEEFDFESASRKPLRGNIYLAKVTRVEPSLQAAFVDYGGNRHGFLAFNEIHPDYYQIPFADRQALIDAEAEDEAEDERAAERAAAKAAKAEAQKVAASEAAGDAVSSDVHAEDDNGEDGGHGEIREVREQEEIVESVGAEDALEEVPERRPQRNRRTYKIQEVIKRRQVLLVQVVKEERGNKGAALTTYLSLAGRYSVLMPNTARGGGISRKITSAQDRKRLKKIASDLEVPEGMGVILRTAGASRTKVEVKRDFEYLLRLWENVRDLTLRSSAPALVYEEGSLIKRSIRDLYNKDIDEVLVGGDEGYREAKDFMRMLMPSHAKNVKAYKDPSPLFTRFGVEAQLDAMFSPQVTLKSGGYIVINQTEALVSIDVNSGRSTREHNIEDTAVQTNLEAADEVARQLRLRDLAGLIVIDFIDMEENKNNRAVERRLKEALKSDRARIQVGRISHFGLMEMSRQRIRTGVVESSTQVCPHCFGTGVVRSTESVALHVLRTIEEALLKSAAHNLNVRTRTAVALYILNQKRRHLADIEARFGVQISISADEGLGTHHHAVEKGELAVRDPNLPPPPGLSSVVHVDSVDPDALIEEEPEEAEDVAEEAPEQPSPQQAGSENGEGNRKRRRRRRRRRGGENGAREANASGEVEQGEDDGDDEGDEHAPAGIAGEAVETAAIGIETGTVTAEDTDADEAPASPDIAVPSETMSAETVSSEGEASEGQPSGAASPDAEAEAQSAEVSEEDAAAARRRRGRRGGRRRRETTEETDAAETNAATVQGGEEPALATSPAADETPAEAVAPEAVHDATPETVAAAPAEEGHEVVAAQTAEPETAELATESPSAEASHESAPAEPEPAAPAAAEDTSTASEEAASWNDAPEQHHAGDSGSEAPEPAPEAPAAEPEVDDRPKRSGWWQRRSFF
ncbi:ribonuclease E [Pseudoxanthobacter soli DSM 19599]|uniref:Ribonuclease E n=1 Tax=Pseudoxanthobacter soli DSM 19599 TaxID=1123029 RepID=A0A1M7ZA64_9HYPH|nr:ribonuclease E/G [Pseudoxanthobacter soli]SHO61815.1 ribonuclease E [Pseudoxanthobacter soli DSM 19599]